MPSPSSFRGEGDMARKPGDAGRRGRHMASDVRILLRSRHSPGSDRAAPASSTSIPTRRNAEEKRKKQPGQAPLSVLFS
eukprot:m.98096 g.98096  ORF g.98096 m.98096 type:complete len:79 (+) comp12419_c0_seq1:1035-1271(+)